jgi:hypothetical protein
MLPITIPWIVDVCPNGVQHGCIASMVSLVELVVVVKILQPPVAES